MKQSHLCLTCGECFWRFPSQTGHYCSRRCSTQAIRIAPATRFWRRVNKTDSCWLWTGRRNNPNGYGVFSLRRLPVYAHRFSYELANGHIPDGRMVLHMCDVKHCVRPDHLFLGDAATNYADMVTKHGQPLPAAMRRPERRPRGASHGHAKLTEAEVRTIREARAQGRTLKSIAADYGVSFGLISLIALRQIWKHV